MVDSTQSNPHCIFYFQRQVLFFFNGINFLRFFEVFGFFNTRENEINSTFQQKYFFIIFSYPYTYATALVILDFET